MLVHKCQISNNSPQVEVNLFTALDSDSAYIAEKGCGLNSDNGKCIGLSYYSDRVCQQLMQPGGGDINRANSNAATATVVVWHLCPEPNFAKTGF